MKKNYCHIAHFYRYVRLNVALQLYVIMFVLMVFAEQNKALCQTGNSGIPASHHSDSSFKTTYNVVLDSAFLAHKQYEKVIPHIGIMKDSTRTMTAAQVQLALKNASFTLLDSTMLPLDPHSAYWLVVEVENKLLTNQQWMVQLGGNDIRAFGRNSFVDVYVVQNGNILAKKYTGYHRPASERDFATMHNAVEVYLPTSQRIQMFIRLERIYGFSVNPTLRLVPPIELERAINHTIPIRVGLSFFLLGALLVMGLFYGLYVGIVREKTYLYFVSFIAGTWLFFTNLFGVFHNFLFLEYPRAEDILFFIGLTLASSESLFVRSFLRLEISSPRWAKVLTWLAYMSAGLSVLGGLLLLIFQHFPTINRVMTISLGSVVIVQIIASIQLFRTGQRLVQYVVAANLVLYGTFSIFLLSLGLPRSLGIPAPLDFSDALYVAGFGAVGRIILFALGFGYRSNMLEEERLQAQQELIQQLQKNEKLQNIANEQLEQKVRERTAELERTNEQVIEAHFEIERQITILEEQSREIEISNTELQEVNQELAAANEFKLKMLGIAAHDLKNPISNILMSAQLLYRKQELQYIEEYTDSIKESSEQMLSIIDDLLESAAIGLGKVELDLHSFDLVTTLNMVCSHYERIVDAKEQQLHITSPEQCFIQGDEVRIRQVIDNLLSNASKYSPLGGMISVTLQGLGEMIQLSVTDSGPGLTENDKIKLFGMFQRLSAKPTAGESSSGVGLASVKNIVELHGGAIDVVSGVGKGSTFIITLPIIAG
jgi:two-component system, sensor histidine kinase LadS